MRRCVFGFFFFMLSLFPFKIEKIKEMNFTPPCYIGRFGRAIGGDGFSTVLGRRCIFSLNSNGRINWILRGEESILRTTYPSLKKAMVRRGNLVFIYDLISGKEETSFSLGQEANWPFQGFCKFLGTYYLFKENLYSVKLGYGSLSRRDVYLYRKEGNSVKLVSKLPVVFTVKYALPYENGLLLFPYASHNRLARNGFADIYGGVYLLGPTLRVISSYRIYGNYLITFPVYLEGNRLCFAYSETHGSGRKKSGVVLFDLERWKPIRELKFSSSMANLKRYRFFHRKGRKYIYFYLNNGRIEVLDAQLNPVLTETFHSVKNDSPRPFFSLYTNIFYDFLKNGYLFLYYAIILNSLDPRHGAIVDIVEKKFVVIKLGEGVVWEKAFKRNLNYFIPVVDFEGGRLSFLEGDRIEVYKMDIII